MRNLDCLLILNHTEGEQDEEVTAGLAALEHRNSSKAGLVKRVDFASEKDVPKLDVAGVKDGGRIGVYVVGHASFNIFDKTSEFRITPELLAAFIARLMGEFRNPDLAKVCLVGCGIARGGEADLTKVTNQQGSYLQKFCLVLNSNHSLSPKVAGWDCFITINRKGSPADGQEALSVYGQKKYKIDKSSKLVTEEARTEHKFAYVCRDGGVAKLELSDWSDKV